MEYKDRKGQIINSGNSQEGIIKFLYETNIGKLPLKILTKKFVSNIAGALLNTRFSSLFIKGFIKKNNINMQEYMDSSFKSYNEFFIRKIKAEARTFDFNPKILCSPCDSKLSVYKINKESIFNIKNISYTFFELTRDKKLEEEFKDGYIMIFRLSVDDYHRYSYVDNGYKSKNIIINGEYNTVNPLATDIYKVYKENQRELSILKSENFDHIMMMEVGAMMVGKIVNYHEELEVKRGMEKGRFEFGGSTVILAFKKNTIIIDDDILKNSSEGYETKVKLGERVGISYNS